MTVYGGWQALALLIGLASKDFQGPFSVLMKRKDQTIGPFLVYPACDGWGIQSVSK